MRTIKVLAVSAAGLACIALLALAQSDADYQGYMKTVAASNAKFQKGIMDKDKGVVMSEGKTLEETFQKVEAFWQTRSAPDAVNFAKQAHNSAAAAVAAAASGNFDQAATEAKGVSGTCAGCHMAHRQKDGGAFKIK